MLMLIIGRPNMPVGVIYLVIWQWGQTFARAVQTLPDGEAIGGGLFGPNVERAYWYMLASVLVLALCMRATLGGVRTPTPQDRNWHARWQARDLMVVYAGTLALSIIAQRAGALAAALDQPLQAVVHLKILALFLLFTNVLTTGRGGRYLIIVMLFETITGFSGILSDFKAVFLLLALAAIASRIRWTFAMGLASVVWLVVLTTLGIFWSGVKGEYRQVATGSDESQAITASLSDRLGYLGTRAMTPSSINWNDAAYSLLIRFAYVDIFGSVITVQEATPEPVFMRQWGEALSHVLQPRFLFPNKPPLSDTEVYVRLAKGDPTEEMRTGTSISVGYMGENFADLGFPGMLAGILVIGLIAGGIYRFFMSRRLPWMVREGTVLVLVYSIARDGVEISLPKLLGALLMVTAVFVILVRYGYPRVLEWLDRPPRGSRSTVRRARA
ncbi:MAG: hypothetical protein JSS04_23525 [Proteobacteria bacterium]|nr:hypothetical protein [Pseudomonadota bacterium]